MKEELLRLFASAPALAIVISLLLSIIVAIIGLLPSVFITAANIAFFGFWPGTALSIAGEALGAAMAFLLYRKGFKKGAGKKLQAFPRLQQLLNADGKEAFMLICSLRLLPFVPSGLVTFAGAIGKVSFPLFVTASTIGKIPALLIEAFAVNEVTQFTATGRVILAVVAALMLFRLLVKKPAAK